MYNRATLHDLINVSTQESKKGKSLFKLWKKANAIRRPHAWASCFTCARWSTCVQGRACFLDYRLLLRAL
eukprot:3323579-Amphidinium_carterae.1